MINLYVTAEVIANTTKPINVNSAAVAYSGNLSVFISSPLIYFKDSQPLVNAMTKKKMKMNDEIPMTTPIISLKITKPT